VESGEQVSRAFEIKTPITFGSAAAELAQWITRSKALAAA
jgi:hypothetical protein